MNQPSKEYIVVIPDYTQRGLDISVFVGYEVLDFLGSTMAHNKWVSVADIIGNMSVAEYETIILMDEEVVIIRTI